MQLELFKVANHVNPADVVYTPDGVAKDIIEWLQPSGKCLDPCYGKGAFYQYLPEGSDFCELSMGLDFFDYDKKVDWIISNPPFSVFHCWMEHSFKLADNVCYTTFLQKPFSAKALRAASDYGRIRAVKVLGDIRGFCGFTAAAFHWKRGYNGPTELVY